MKELGTVIEEEEKLSQIDDLTKKLSIENIDVLGLNSENYITFKRNNMWFIDSFKFMSGSLSSIVKTLTKEDMELANKLYKLNGINSDQIDTLSKKNIFPYIWFDSYEKMNASSLPGREYFNQHVDQQKNDEDYDYATKAWEKLGCKTFEEYHDKYAGRHCITCHMLPCLQKKHL